MRPAKIKVMPKFLRGTHTGWNVVKGAKNVGHRKTKEEAIWLAERIARIGGGTIILYRKDKVPTQSYRVVEHCYIVRIPVKI